MLGNVVEEPVSAVPPPLNNVDCVEKDVKPWRQHWTRRDGEGVGGGGGGKMAGHLEQFKGT